LFEATLYSTFGGCIIICLQYGIRPFFLLRCIYLPQGKHQRARVRAMTETFYQYRSLLYFASYYYATVLILYLHVTSFVLPYEFRPRVCT
jgi:hypothetical protein